MNALDHYDKLYGDLGLSPKDAAQYVFVSGWNCAVDEMLRRMKTMKLPNNTLASFAVYFGNMLEISTEQIEKKMENTQ